MNHQEKEIMRRVYDGHDYSGEMRSAWELAGQHITALMQGGATIYSLRRRTL